MRAGAISVELTGNEGPLLRAIARAEAALNRVPVAAHNAGVKVGALAERFAKAAQEAEKFSQLSGALTRIGVGLGAVGAAGTAAAVGIGKLGAEFQQTVTEAAAIAGGVEGFGTSLEAMTAEAIRLGATTKYTGAEVGSTFKALAMAGRDTEQAIAAMPSVLQLAASANMDLARSGEIVMAVMNGYQLGASDLQSVNDMLVGTFTGAATTLEDLGESFRVAGATAKLAKVNHEELAAVFGVLGNVGIKGADAGQGMKMALINLLGPSKTLAAAQKKLGISGKMLAEQGMVAVVGQLEKMHKAAAATGKEVEFAGLVMDAFGTRAGPRMASLVGQGTKALEQMRAKIDEAQAQTFASELTPGEIKVGKAAFLEEKQLSTPLGQITVMESTLESVALTISQALLPPFLALVRMVTAAANVFNGLGSSTKTFLSYVAAAAAGLAVLTTGLGATLAAVGMMLQPLMMLAALSGTTLAGAFMLVAAKLVLLVKVLAVVGLAVGVFVVAYKAAAAVMRVFGAGLPDGVSLLSVLGDAFEQATGSLRGFATVVVNVVFTALDLLLSLWKKVPVIGRHVEAAIAGMHSKVMELVDSIEENSDAAKGATKATSGFGAAVDTLGSLAEGVMGDVGGAFDDTTTKIDAARRALEQFAELRKRISEDREKMELARGARSVFDVGQKFRADLGEAGRLAVEARAAPGGAAAMRELGALQADRLASFMVEVREALEQVPFRDFAAALDVARSDLEGWLSEEQLAAFLKTVKAPPSPNAELQNALAGARDAGATAGLTGPFAAAATASLGLQREIDALTDKLAREGESAATIAEAAMLKRAIADANLQTEVTRFTANLRRESADLKASVGPIGEALDVYRRVVEDTARAVAQNREALAVAGATPDQISDVDAALRLKASAQIVAAFNGASLGVDEHRVEIEKARAALALLGVEGEAAADALRQIAAPQDLSGLLSGRVGEIVDAIAEGMGLSIRESDRGAVVKNISDALADLLSGGSLDFGKIGKAVGQLIGGGGGGDMLSAIFGLGGAGAAAGGAGGIGGAAAGAAGGGAVGAVGGPMGALVGAAVVGLIVAALPVVIDAVKGVADGIGAAVQAIPRALQDFFSSLADVTGDQRLKDAVSAAFNPVVLGAVVLATALAALSVVFSPVLIYFAYLAVVLGAIATALVVLTVAALPLVLMLVGLLAIVGVLISAAMMLVGALVAVAIITVAIAVAFAMLLATVFLMLTGLGVPLMIIGAAMLTSAAMIVGAASMFAVGIALAMGLLALSLNTKSFKRVQDAFGVVIDKVVLALEPFWDGMIALAGLFDVFVGVLMPIIGAFVGTDLAARVLFEVFKVGAVIVGHVLLAFGIFVNVVFGLVAILAQVGIGLVTVFAPVVDAIGALAQVFDHLRAAVLDLMAGILAALGQTDLADAAAASAAAVRDAISDVPFSQTVSDALRGLIAGMDAMSPDTAAMQAALDVLMGLTYDEAKARGENLRSLQEMNEELTNIPEGFKTANARFRAIAADDLVGFGNVDNGAGAAPAGNNFIIDAVNVTANDARQFAEDLDRAARFRRNQQTGGPFSDPFNNGGG